MNQRGRPQLEFARDRDRRLAALALAYQALGMSLRGGCEAAVATVEGLPIGPNLNRGHGGHGLSMLDLRYELKRRPGAAATIEGRARGLRQKIRKWQRNPPAGQWLLAMCRACLVALQTAPPDPAAADREITELAGAAGEGEFGEQLLELAKITRLGVKWWQRWAVR